MKKCVQCLLYFLFPFLYCDTHILIASESNAQKISTEYRMLDYRSYDREIQKLYQNPKLTHDTVLEKIDFMSAYFLGKPYLLSSLGEGMNGKFDQAPLYRTDKVDCTTFVSTVLALAISNNLQEFKKNILKIRYKNGIKSYLYRNHFISVDWNTNEHTYHFTKDITSIIYKHAKQTHTAIAKKNWYQHMTKEYIKLIHGSPQLTEKKLNQLQYLSHKVHNVISQITYIPLDALIDNNNHPNQELFKKIPSGSIIEIIAHYNNLKKAIGTDIDVVHMGFAIRKNNQLYFREASSYYQKVIDIPLVEYLEKLKKHSIYKGIHVELPR